MSQHHAFEREELAQWPFEPRHQAVGRRERMRHRGDPRFQIVVAQLLEPSIAHRPLTALACFA
ncbi:hypothetical protein [Variovorax sp. KK3]|uniref:hypothetical protein n=1 Tax=Variovorax sp. KK3 TaxID=1855728 RepID=UPI0015C3E61E|nr:hypothetical protein [Variovorax sp. KK3]